MRVPRPGLKYVHFRHRGKFTLGVKGRDRFIDILVRYKLRFGGFTRKWSFETKSNSNIVEQEQVESFGQSCIQERYLEPNGLERLETLGRWLKI